MGSSLCSGARPQASQKAMGWSSVLPRLPRPSADAIPPPFLLPSSPSLPASLPPLPLPMLLFLKGWSVHTLVIFQNPGYRPAFLGNLTVPLQPTPFLCCPSIYSEVCIQWSEVKLGMCMHVQVCRSFAREMRRKLFTGCLSWPPPDQAKLPQPYLVLLNVPGTFSQLLYPFLTGIVAITGASPGPPEGQTGPQHYWRSKGPRKVAHCLIPLSNLGG